MDISASHKATHHHCFSSQTIMTTQLFTWDKSATLMHLLSPWTLSKTAPEQTCLMLWMLNVSAMNMAYWMMWSMGPTNCTRVLVGMWIRGQFLLWLTLTEKWWLFWSDLGLQKCMYESYTHARGERTIKISRKYISINLMLSTFSWKPNSYKNKLTWYKWADDTVVSKQWKGTQGIPMGMHFICQKWGLKTHLW